MIFFFWLMVVGIWSRWKMSLRQSRGKECTSCVVLQQSRERERHAVWRSAVWWPLHACSRWAASCSLTCVAQIEKKQKNKINTLKRLLIVSIPMFFQSIKWSNSKPHLIVSLLRSLPPGKQPPGSPLATSWGGKDKEQDHFHPTGFAHMKRWGVCVCVPVCTLTLELITWQLARAPENLASPDEHRRAPCRFSQKPLGSLFDLFHRRLALLSSLTFFVFLAWGLCCYFPVFKWLIRMKKQLRCSIKGQLVV